AEELAAHEEAGYLLAAFAVHHAGLEEAAADRVDGVELVARVEERLAALHAAARVDDVLHALEVLEAAAGQAELAQVAARAGEFGGAASGGGVGLCHEDGPCGVGLELGDGWHERLPSFFSSVARRRASRSPRARARIRSSCRRNPAPRGAARSCGRARTQSWTAGRSRCPAPAGALPSARRSRCPRRASGRAPRRRA